MSEFSNRFTLLNDIIDRIENYYSIVRKNLEQSTDVIYQNLIKNLKELKMVKIGGHLLRQGPEIRPTQILDEIPKREYIIIDDKEVILKLNKYVEIYQTLAAIDNTLSSITTLFSTDAYYDGLGYELTSRAMTDRNMINTKIHEYHKTSDKEDQFLFGELAFYISNPNAQFLPWLNQDPPINKFTIAMISYVIERVDAVKKARLVAIIEEKKLASVECPKRRLLEFTGVQAMLLSSQLKPLTRCMSSTDICNFLGGGLTMINTIKDIGKNGIFLDCTSKSAIEFNIEAILNDIPEKYNPNAGLNKKYIEKYNTVNALIPGITEGKPIQIYMNDPSAEWVILQTLDGYTWRILSRDGKKWCTANEVRNLIHGPTLLPHAYNSIMENKIMNLCYDQHAKLILQGYASEKISITSTETQREKIVSAILDRFRQSRIITYAGIIEFMERDLTTLIANTYPKQKTTIEYTLTRMARFYRLAARFHKIMSKKSLKLDENQITRALKETYNPAKIAEDTYIDMVRETLDELDAEGMFSIDNTLKEYYLSYKRKY